jgi:hydroxypyruvate reductase
VQFDLPALERLDGTARVLRAHALAIFAAALRAVDPAAAVRRHLHRAGDTLWAGEHRYDLRRYDRVLLVGAGKAGAPMAAAVEEVLGDRLTDGVVVVKRGYGGPTRVVALVEAGHPVPDEAGVQGGERIARLLSEASERDLVIAVISGGGSALLTWPAPGITLADLQALTNALLRSGATINEINTVRKHLDRAKGGGLARLAQPAEVLTLVLSDVVGDPLDAIADRPRPDDVRRRGGDPRPLRALAADAAGGRRLAPRRAGRPGRRDAEARRPALRARPGRRRREQRARRRGGAG